MGLFMSVCKVLYVSICHTARRLVSVCVFVCDVCMHICIEGRDLCRRLLAGRAQLVVFRRFVMGWTLVYAVEATDRGMQRRTHRQVNVP